MAERGFRSLTACVLGKRLLCGVYWWAQVCPDVEFHVEFSSAIIVPIERTAVVIAYSHRRDSLGRQDNKRFRQCTASHQVGRILYTFRPKQQLLLSPDHRVLCQGAFTQVVRANDAQHSRDAWWQLWQLPLSAEVSRACLAVASQRRQPLAIRLEGL